jgi:two-component system sensor histidine kinase DesK
MLFALFQPSQNSIFQEAWPSSSSSGSRVRWYPLLMLVWSIWIFVTPIMEKDWPHWVWPTFGSYAVFLVLFRQVYYGDRRWVLLCSLGIAALAFAVTPVNAGAQGYLIYACGFLAFTGRPRTTIRYMLVLCGLYALEWWLLGFYTVYMFTALIVAFAVGLMNIAYVRRREMEAEVRLSHDEVRRLAALAERERIGRDLHDLLGHTLSLITLKSELANKLFDRDAGAAKREMADVERVARDALAQVRRAVTGIRAAGFAAELASAKLLLESNGVTLEYAISDALLPPELETALAMTVREAATNIQRHAEATQARIALERDGDNIVLRVEDNGRGGAIVPGNGLSGMRERLTGVGAIVRIESQRGRGTQLTVIALQPRQTHAPVPAPLAPIAPAVP